MICALKEPPENTWHDCAAKVTVAGPTGIAVTPANSTLLRGSTEQFVATVTFPDQTVTADQYVIWSTEAPSVATINKSGLATGVSLGSTNIDATLAGTVGTTAA